MGIKLIYEAFEKQVEKYSDCLAVADDNYSISYKELNSRANQLAHYLRNQGVDRGNFVGICMERSCDLLVAILAVLKAGGAYIPLDPSYPCERLKFMAEHSKLTLILTKESHVNILRDFNIKLVMIDNVNHFNNFSTKNLGVKNKLEDPIYAIYTSGSTGNPKGVVIKHEGFSNLVEWYINEFNLSSIDRILVFTSFSFDLTQKNLVCPLLVGGQVHLFQSINYDPEEIVNSIYCKKITRINSTPSAFYPLLEFANQENLDMLSSLTYIFVGGEPLSLSRAQAILKIITYPQLVNTYGPTECSDVCLFYRVRPDDYLKIKGYVPLGNEIPGMQMLILNENLQPVIDDEIGEMYIKGIGVGIGYLNDPILTDEKFCSIDSNDFSSKIYRSGDLCRYLSNKTIEFINRVDFQVKIRGFRIELGEIEAGLKRYPLIRDALVVIAQEKEPICLIAYIVCHHVINDSQQFFSSVISFIRKFLPSYMLPTHIMCLEKFPLTQNGKLDRKKLPPVEACVNFFESAIFEKPQTPTQLRLISLYSKILHIPPEKISMHDNFFERGGDSLSAIQLLSRVKEAFKIRLSIKNIFENPTPFHLNNFIEKSKDNLSSTDSIYSLDTFNNSMMYYPLSFPQQRIWFVQNNSQNKIIYNNLITLCLEGPLNMDALVYAFSSLCKRHEILRTHVTIREQIPFQKVALQEVLNIKCEDYYFCNIEARDSLIFKIAQEEVNIPFDLHQLPLWRLKVLNFSEEMHVLILTIHQFVIDGWSMAIFYKELSFLYNSFILSETSQSLSPIMIQYAPYWEQQNRYLSSDLLKKDFLYWENQLLGRPEIPISFPFKKSCPTKFSYRGAVYTCLLTNVISLKIKAFAETHHSTLFMLLLTCYGILLSLYSGQNDLIIGTPLASRNVEYIENLIGFFTNLLPIRLQINQYLTFSELLSTVRDTALEAYTHQDVPFFKLLEYLKVQRQEGYHPLFQVVFAMQPYRLSELKLKDLLIKDLDIEEPVAKFDLALNVSDKPFGLELKFEYATDLFNEEMIQQFSEDFKILLNEVIGSKDFSLVDYMSSFANNIKDKQFFNCT